jgi:hypothetical protein
LPARGLLTAIRRQRAAVQMLHRSAGIGPVEIVRRLLAVQAQELRGARLALRARGEGFTAADVDAALTEERSLVRGWLGRGTLHLVAREDYPWLLALTAPTRFANSRRRLGQEGVSADDAERALGVIERALADEGPLRRDELAERIAAQGIPTEGQATPHLLALAALRGIAVLGPLRRSGQAFALARDWLDKPTASDALGAAARDWLDAAPAGGSLRAGATAELVGADRETALAELARRYLAAHGPAAAADLAAWAGLPLRDVRAGLAAIAGETTELGDGLVDLAGRPPSPERVPPRLLPAFDPYLMGWKDRTFAVPAEHARRVHPGGGIIRPTATLDGVVVGTWSRSEGLDPFARIGRADAAALEAEAADVARFEG